MARTRHWEKTNLGSIATFTNGGAWNASEYVALGIPVVRVTDCQNGTVNISACKYLSETAYVKYQKHELEEGDLVVATVGSHPTQPGSVVGRPIVVPREARGALLNQNAVCIRPITESILNKSFLANFAKTSSFSEYIISCARGSANQVRMAIGLLKEMPIELPPINTQQKIAAILSAYDNLIENNLRRIMILEEMAQNLYREWFVKFHFPGHEQARFTDSPLGRIPERWEISSVGHVSSLVSRGPSLKYSKQKGIPVLNQRCIRDGEISLNTIQHAEPLGKNKQHLYLQQYDILINSMGVGTLGRVSRNVSIIGEMIIHNCITVVRPDVSRVSAQQLFYCLRDNQTRFESLGIGATGQTSLQSTVIKETPILLPAEEVSKQFQVFVLPLWDQVGVLKRRNEVLRRTRDLLLPKLISGEVDVSELDITIPEEVAT